MPNIFSFTDYRKFIKAWYAEQKRRRPKVTLRSIAAAVGFNSPAHIAMILKNKARLSEDRAVRLAEAMHLNKKESRYFLLIINYNHARSLQDKNRILRKMVQFNRTGTVLLSPDQYEYYQKWYYAAVHDILSFYPFNGDFGGLAKMVEPSISQREAAKAVALLERLRFIIKKEDGTYTCAFPGISAYTEGHSLVLGAYAETMMERARHALRRLPGEERAISWAGFSMSRQTFEKVKEEARDFRKRIVAMAQADRSPDRAYHINMQIFPVSRRFQQLRTERQGEP
jgi:uncharacterized protein (TIGR02147 family)